MSKKVEQTVEELTAGLIEQMGYELADVEFAKEGGNHVLTLFIDKPGRRQHRRLRKSQRGGRSHFG